MRGYLVNGMVVCPADGSGLEVVETSEPSHVEGYETSYEWVESMGQIVQVWRRDPVGGTAQEAALRLATMQAESLPDEALYEVRALAPEYVDGMTCYGEGNEEGMPVTRVRYLGELYRFVGQGTQVMQPGWNPVDAPSLWARILPGQEGSGDEVGPWEQPGSTNGYKTGDRVTHNDHLWESTADNNVWEPGAVGAPWKDLGEWDGSTRAEGTTGVEVNAGID